MKVFREYACILLGSVLYALGTVLFIFPQRLLLGGTSGISVILERLLPFSPGTILMVINFLLIFLAFAVLGRSMATKTLVGSVLTTVSIGIFEKLCATDRPLIGNVYLSAAVGAAVIALAGALMFYVDSSSGGTDIVALIVKKFSNIRIGRALLITDVLIVLVGGVLSGAAVLVSSFAGLLIKTLGIDLCIGMFSKWFPKRRGTRAE